MSFNLPHSDRKRVVIVGGGFGGLRLCNKLRHSGFQVVLVDRNNYHQFPPLIYQIASSGIEPSSISFPFRKIFQKRHDFFFRMAEVRSIFPEHNIIQTSIGKVRYDYLVFRNALLDNFERALTCATEAEREELLNVVIVGGGATGVEIAGAIAEMKRFVMPKDYPDLPTDLMHINLIEAGPRLLAGMSQKSSAAVERYLRGMGVNVMLNTMVTDFADHRVILKDGRAIPTRSFIWVSGVTGQPIGNMDESHFGRGHRIKVDAYNRVEGLEGVFAIGDQCIMTDDPAYPGGHPQLAQVAIQQGTLLAKNLRRLERGEELRPFRYRNLGAMATVGRNRAVAEFNRVKMSGFLAWVMWLVVHLRSILGVRNKIIVLFNWVWNYISYSQSLRMIVYAKKAKEVREREAMLASTHWGMDLMSKGLEDKKQA